MHDVFCLMHKAMRVVKKVHLNIMDDKKYKYFKENCADQYVRIIAEALRSSYIEDEDKDA